MYSIFYLSNQLTVEHLIPSTLSFIKDNRSGCDTDIVKDMFGLLRVRDGEADSWRRIAENATSKWAHWIPGSVGWMWRDAALVKIGIHDRCAATDLEAVRGKMAQHDLIHLDKDGEHDNDGYWEEAEMLQAAMDNGLKPE